MPSKEPGMNYLKNADMLRSHPYFWSALVIYGNNDSLYHSERSIILAGAADYCSAWFYSSIL